MAKWAAGPLTMVSRDLSCCCDLLLKSGVSVIGAVVDGS
jgi:hypothetical protein